MNNPMNAPADAAASTSAAITATTDPLKLAKTRAFDDPRFEDLLDPVPPVGPTA